MNKRFTSLVDAPDEAIGRMWKEPKRAGKITASSRRVSENLLFIALIHHASFRLDRISCRVALYTTLVVPSPV